jgi:tetratricopeptide (TPR) repeat protein
MSHMLGGDPTGALPSHRRAVELDPRSTICRICAAVALVAAEQGKGDEAAGHFEWLERQPSDDHLAAVALRFRHALAGNREAVLSPPSGAVRAMAESDEYWSYLTAAAYALVGQAEEALSWLEHAVTVRGWVDYVYFTRHDRFLESLRAAPRFQELMASAQERYARFTDDGAAAPTLLAKAISSLR